MNMRLLSNGRRMMAISLKERVNRKQAVLVILDMQEGSWPAKAGPVGGEEILTELLPLLKERGPSSCRSSSCATRTANGRRLRAGKSRLPMSALIIGPDIGRALPAMSFLKD